MKYFCASLLILVSGVMSAQEQECLTFDVDYSMEVTESAKLSGNAVVTIQDNAYRMSGNGIEAYCDGSSIWMLDNEAKEVYIESVGSASESYLSNPAQVLKELSKEQEGTYTLDDGRKVHIKVNSIKKSDRKDVSSFRPTVEFNSDWVVTDLR